MKLLIFIILLLFFAYNYLQCKKLESFVTVSEAQIRLRNFKNKMIESCQNRLKEDENDLKVMGITLDDNGVLNFSKKVKFNQKAVFYNGIVFEKIYTFDYESLNYTKQPRENNDFGKLLIDPEISFINLKTNEVKYYFKFFKNMYICTDLSENIIFRNQELYNAKYTAYNDKFPSHMNCSYNPKNDSGWKFKKVNENNLNNSILPISFTKMPNMSNITAYKNYLNRKNTVKDIFWNGFQACKTESNGNKINYNLDGDFSFESSEIANDELITLPFIEKLIWRNFYDGNLEENNLGYPYNKNIRQIKYPTEYQLRRHTLNYSLIDLLFLVNEKNEKVFLKNGMKDFNYEGKPFFNTIFKDFKEENSNGHKILFCTLAHYYDDTLSYLILIHDYSKSNRKYELLTSHYYITKSKSTGLGFLNRSQPKSYYDSVASGTKINNKVLFIIINLKGDKRTGTYLTHTNADTYCSSYKPAFAKISDKIDVFNYKFEDDADIQTTLGNNKYKWNDVNLRKFDVNYKNSWCIFEGEWSTSIEYKKNKIDWKINQNIMVMAPVNLIQSDIDFLENFDYNTLVFKFKDGDFNDLEIKNNKIIAFTYEKP